jgi:hypothetical protein
MILGNRTIGLGLSDCHFFCYHTNGISSNSGNYQNIKYRVNVSIYRITDSQKTLDCPALRILLRGEGHTRRAERGMGGQYFGRLEK